ncbi:Uu.00g118210.m01.CDS01 [Anthostomella pinea]|uniref:Uu.00g118210.m01.CDS01 n=1 Tax=Anthostomella pinea TaxID=933095 RepID=A0AAI8YH52_9PEZI|nr:Uu.00g118210.m01.CDS01 [Anthostomella pinea]
MEDEIAKLRSQLAEEQHRRREEQRRREQAEALATEEQHRREEEQHRREEEQRRREQAEQQTRQTTLMEYIQLCHDLIFSQLVIETDKRLTSKGSITNPRDKWCPALMLPWLDFFDQQKAVFRDLHSTFPGDTEAFESRSFLQGLGERIARGKVANERDLEYFQHTSVEDPVRSIIERFRTEGGVKSEFDIAGGIVFENHPNAISDMAEEVLARRADTTQARPTTPNHALRRGSRLCPDQICVYRDDGTQPGGRTAAYIIEYKAPHKLTAPHLRLGLRRMDICKEVVNRSTIPAATNNTERFRYHADKLTAAAVTQTFHYMIEGGLEYSYLTTGEVIVFLKIDWSDPTKLYYHLAEPGPEVAAHPDQAGYCTAVGQVLAFSLMAFGKPGQRQKHAQEERRSAMKHLQTWTEDYEEILRSIPASERRAPPNSAGYEPSTYKKVNRSPYDLRGKKKPKRLIVDQDRPAAGTPGRNQTPDPSEDESEQHLSHSPTPTGSRNRSRPGQHSQPDSTQQSCGANTSTSPQHQYCTNKCLLGLVHGTFLDDQCPNVALHRGKKNGDCHPVSHSQWLHLLKEQLERTLDDGIVCLGKQGARGVLFQVTLLEHGYTFVSKGTISEYVQDLEHEISVYRRLSPAQGVDVPVCLGAIDLRDISRIYYYDFRVRVVYMMFLAWGGRSLHDLDPSDTVPANLSYALVRSVQTLHTMGVAHADVRMSNFLWNEENYRVMSIDFERAILMDPPRLPLAQVNTNKRKRTAPDLHDKPAAKPASQADYRRLIADDISAARSIS